MAGWPWPLNGVQSWFESLWNWVSESAFNAVNYALNILDNSFKWLNEQVSGFVSWLWDSIQSGLNWIIEQTQGFVSWLWDNIVNSFTWLGQQVSGFINWLWSMIEPGLKWVVEQATGFISWLWDQISSGVNFIINSVKGFFTWLWEQVNNVINGLIEYIKGGLTYVIDTLKTFIGGAFNQFISALLTIVKPAIDTFIESIGSIVEALQKVAEQFGQFVGSFLISMYNTLTGAVEEVYKWQIAQYQEFVKYANEYIIQPLNQSLRESLNNIASALTQFYSGWGSLPPEVAARRCWDYLNNISWAFFGLTVSTVLLEAASIGQLDMTLMSVFENPYFHAARANAEAVMTTFFKYTYEPALRRYYLSAATPEIPEPRDLIDMYFREIIKENELYTYMREHGYDDSWIYKTLQLAERIPGPSDLVRFVVREVITPDDFIKWMKKQKYSEYWSKAYWEAHWQLPSFENIREAFWRGIVNEDEFRKYVVWHDYKPEPRPGISKSDLDIMFELSFRLPGRIDTRWMYEWGIIDKEDVKKLLAMDGLHPDWLDKVAEAETRNVLRDEVGRIRSVLERLYEKGYIGEEDLRKELKALGFRDEVIELTVRWAKLSLQEEIMDTLLKTYEEAYEKQQIDETELRALIGELIKDPHLAKLKADLIILKKMPKPKRPREILS